MQAEELLPRLFLERRAELRGRRGPPPGQSPTKVPTTEVLLPEMRNEPG